MICSFRSQLILLLTCLYVPMWGSTPDSAYFLSVQRAINQNLESEHYVENYSIYDRMMGTDSFMQLSCFQKGQLVHKIGVSYYLDYKEYQAIRVFKEVLDDYWKNCKEVPTVEYANTLYNVGVSYQYTPEIHLGSSYIDRAILILEDAQVDSLELAIKYQGAGNYYSETKDQEKAETYFNNAINLYQAYPDEVLSLFDIYNELIILNLEFKRYASISTYLKAATGLQQANPDQIQEQELALVLLNGAIAEIELLDYDKAERFTDQALQLIDPELQTNLLSNAWEIKGVINQRRGNFEMAKRYFDQILDIRIHRENRESDLLSRAIAYENLSDLYRENDLFNHALYNINLALQELFSSFLFDQRNNPILEGHQISHPLDAIRMLNLKAQIINLSNQDDSTHLHNQVIHIYLKIDSIIDLSISNLSIEASKIEWYELIEKTYHGAVESAVEFHKVNDNAEFLIWAQHFSSRAKSLILQKHLFESSNLELILETDQLAKRKELLEELVQAKSSLEQTSGQQLDSLTQIYANALLEWTVFNENLNAENDQYARQINAYQSLPDLGHVQEVLVPGQVIIDYYFTESRLYSFWITQDEFFIKEERLNTQKLKDISNYAEACLTPDVPFSKELAHEVYKILLEQGINQLTDIDHLIIIPDGALFKIAFEALTDEPNGEYLINDYAVHYHYSSGLINAMDQIRGPINYVGFGSNYSNLLIQNLENKTSLGNLTLGNFLYATEEVNQGKQIFKGQSFLDRQANIQNFFSQIGNADVLHLSLHGLVDLDNPSKSCIVFDDREENILLTPLNLQPETLESGLVFLSACHSASGKIYQGEGVQGMSRVFLYAGAHAVLSSLWSATETTAMQLSDKLFKEIKSGSSLEQAVRQARLSYLKQASPSLSHPYYWANFILIGNPVQFVEPSLFNKLLWIIIPIILVILFMILNKRVKP